MPGPCRAFLLLILVGGAVAPAQARKWTDITGKYTLEADLVGFDDEAVILQRESKELGSIAINQLSLPDQEFLKSQEAQAIHNDNINQMQTWTTQSGIKVIGRIVDYVKSDMVLQRRRAKTYINDKVFENLPEIYQRMLPKIVAQLEGIDMPDAKALEAWVRDLRGIPKTYNLEGVIIELENGDEYSVPFFLLSEKDQQILKPGWEHWLADHGDYEKQDDHAFRLQAQAAAYHQDQQVNQQIAIMNLNMQAIQAGLTSAWEVTLYPVAGNPSPPRWVVTMGRNSLIATDVALRQNPGFRSGPVRRVSN
jgi:hypothetical protein